MRKTLNALFGYRAKYIRTCRGNGQIVCVVKDLCLLMRMSKSNTSNLIKQLDESMKCKVYVQNGVRKMLCINKVGLFAVMMHGKKSEAVFFRKWLCTEVLTKMRLSKKMIFNTRHADGYYGVQIVNY